MSLPFSCAFPNTPKFTQVQKTGQGSIVSKQWILDCYDQNQFLSEKDYELKGAKASSTRSDTPRRTSERKPTNIATFDDVEENEEPVTAKSVQRRSHTKKKITTFDDDEDEEEEEESISQKAVIRKALKRNNRTISDDDDDTNGNVQGFS